MNLPYNFVVQHVKDDHDDYYFGKVLELDGCQSDGETVEELYKNLQEAMEGWLETKLEFGDPIPEPVTQSNYSGKFVVRVPKSLHQKLSMEAEKEGISLNQYALYKLSK